MKRHAGGDAGSELDLLVQSSGKMLLLHKLLPKLKAEGHKVHIFILTLNPKHCLEVQNTAGADIQSFYFHRLTGR